jgi:hypothetical protein
MKLLHKFLHTSLPNIALVVGVFLLVRVELLTLAFVLFAVSKWQVLLGGRRLWLLNLRDHACDIIVGVSIITAMALVAPDTALQLTLAVLFAGWLMIIKPLENVVGIGAQALMCQFAGISVLFLVASDLPQIFVILASWFVSVIAINHFLTIFQRPERVVLAFSWGLLVAQTSWLASRWLITYSFFDGRLVIPQISLIVTIMGYAVGSIYKDHAERSLQKTRLVEYVILSVALLLVVIIGTDWVSQV